MNLYKLSQEMQKIIEMGYDEETTKELLEGYEIIGEEQIDDIVKGIRNIEASINGYEYEISRLSDAKESFMKQKQSLQLLIDNYMKTTKTDKINTSIARLSYRKSESIKILNEDEIDDYYWREKTKREIDKIKIKEDIKKGIIVEGATLTINQNLQIK